jgi:hypothetical protein
MHKWMTRIGRAALMGFAWAVVWVPIGMLTGRLIVGEVEPEHVGGSLYPSFLCGALFSALSGIATGRVRLDDLPVSRAAAWGAVSGMLIGALPFVLGGDQHNPGERPLWVLPVAVISSLAVLSAFSAAISLPIARLFSKNLRDVEAQY